MTLETNLVGSRSLSRGWLSSFPDTPGFGSGTQILEYNGEKAGYHLQLPCLVSTILCKLRYEDDSDDRYRLQQPDRDKDGPCRPVIERDDRGRRRM